jgi:cytochrome c oxidase cbb3-type subunit III
VSEFTDGFWDLYIALITVLSIVACGALLWSQNVPRASGGAPTTGHVWDEDLAEYNNPLPGGAGCSG